MPQPANIELTKREILSLEHYVAALDQTLKPQYRMEECKSSLDFLLQNIAIEEYKMTKYDDGFKNLKTTLTQKGFFTMPNPNPNGFPKYVARNGKHHFQEMYTKMGTISECRNQRYETHKEETDSAELVVISLKIFLKNYFRDFKKYEVECLTNLENELAKIIADLFVTQEKTITKSSEGYIATVSKLQELYETDQIQLGIDESIKSYQLYGNRYRILRHVFRFNMRDRNWDKIRKTIDSIELETIPENLVTLCKLTLCECEMREAYILYASNPSIYKEKLLNTRRILNEAPDSARQYEGFQFWLGRYFVEMWWVTEDITNLTSALSHFNKAIKIRYRWWYHCHKCIVLKLLKRQEFTNESKEFQKSIFTKLDKKKKQPSVRTYCITSFLLLDDLNGLLKFLEDITEPTEPTDFQMTIIHQIELIYHFDQQKKDIYKRILLDWISSLPTK